MNKVFSSSNISIFPSSKESSSHPFPSLSKLATIHTLIHPWKDLFQSTVLQALLSISEQDVLLLHALNNLELIDETREAPSSANQELLQIAHTNQFFLLKFYETLNETSSLLLS